MGVTAPERVPASAERLRTAQHVLATAEAATGLRTMLPQAASERPMTRAQPSSVPPGQPTAGPPTAGSPTFPTAFLPTAVSDRLLPVPEALVPLIPFGGLRRGSAVRVERSTSLLLAVAAAACGNGAWCAVVGMPHLGLAAAAELGLPLDRAVLVPSPGADTPAVLGAAIDGFDVIVLGDVPHLVERDRRQLASRLRHRQAVLLTAGQWPGVEVVLSVTESRWGGVGQGHGSLRGRDLTVRVGGRGAAGGRGVQARLRSPDGVRLVTASGAVVQGHEGSGAVDVDRRAG